MTCRVETLREGLGFRRQTTGLDSSRSRLNRVESAYPRFSVISEPADESICLEITLIAREGEGCEPALAFVDGERTADRRHRTLNAIDSLAMRTAEPDQFAAPGEVDSAREREAAGMLGREPQGDYMFGGRHVRGAAMMTDAPRDGEPARPILEFGELADQPARPVEGAVDRP